MRILVTGASGFIGRHLLSRLLSGKKDGDVFYAVVRRVPDEKSPGIEWIQADMEEEEWLESLPSGEVDCVVHLAQSRHHREFPERTMDIFNINVRATVAVADFSLRRGVRRFLFASTGNVYGSKEVPSHEEDACNPETMYAASKLAGEMLLKPFSSFMDIQILRLFGVYGPGQKDAMIPNIIRKFLQNEEIFLAGNVGVRFNPVYVDDCVSVMCDMLKRQPSKKFDVFNVGGAEVVDLRDLVSFLEAYSGKKAPVRITRTPPTVLIGGLRHEIARQTGGVDFKKGLTNVLLSMGLGEGGE